LQDVFVYFCCFVASFWFSQEERFPRRLHIFAVVFGFLLAMFAILQKFSGTPDVYWVRPTDIGSFFGPYYNRNHFAGLMEMLVPFALVNALSRYHETGKRVVYGFATLLMLFSIVLSRSRGGMVCSIAACVVVVLLRGATSTQSKRDIAVYISMLAALGAGMWYFNASELFSRFGQTGRDLPGRFQVTIDSLRIAADHPWLGTGLGTFTSIYPQYKSVSTDIFMNAAHNDYAQLAVETGLLGFLIVLAFAALCLWRGYRSVRDSSPARRLTFIAALSGFVALLLNSFVEFNLQMPANAIWFSVLAGVLCARASAREEPSTTAIRAMPPGEIILPARYE
jgi:O-antigen ligase